MNNNNMNHQGASLSNHHQFLNMAQLQNNISSSPNNNNNSNGKMKEQQWNGTNFQIPFESSLLGMAAASMFTEKPMFMQQQQHQQQQQQERADAQAITSQVLAELAGDSLFDTTPPTDDIFDLEPVPLAENHQRQQQQQQSQHQQAQTQSRHAAPNRLALLEDTLNQVLNDESDFFSMEGNSLPTPAPLLSSTIKNYNNTITPNSSPAKRSLMQDSSSSSSPMGNVVMMDHHPHQPCFKKQRTLAPIPAPTFEDNADEKGERFRDYQSKQWSEKFQELMEFKKQRGHCCVPHTFKENPPLARWVKRQRYQYKLKNENKPSTMTDERILALEQMGFVWDSHGAAWEERLSELKDYRDSMGHCNVPSNYSSNPQLATWVKCQRRQYKLFWDGKPSNMTLERISKLENLGFEWELRGPKKSKMNNMAAAAAAVPNTNTNNGGWDL